MIKVTVLVAVYNAAPYLRKCLDSLLNQSLSDIQIICIDDASTDDSVEIIQLYMHQDKRIRLVRQTVNKGQAKARNKGLAYADGQYITMVDSDDWLSLDALERAYTQFQQNPYTDVVLFQLKKWTNGREEDYPMQVKECVLEGKEAFELSLDWRIHGLYMVKACLQQQYQYDDSCRLYSDDNTTRIHYLHAREVRFCEGIYYYRQHESSTTQRFSILRFEHIKANWILKRQLLSEQVDGKIIGRFERYRWNVFVGMYRLFQANRDQLSNEEREEVASLLQHFFYSMETYRIPCKIRIRTGCLFQSYVFFRFFQSVVRMFGFIFRRTLR